MANQMTGRNPLDVATELTTLYYEYSDIEKPEKIRDVFLKFYAAVKTASIVEFPVLIEYLPEELKRIVNEKYSNYR